MGRNAIGLVCLCLWTVAVIVRGQDVNVAPGKTYSQSSKYSPQGPSDRAANGETSGSFPTNCIHTLNNGDIYPWWEVDLGRTYPVNNISIWALIDYETRLYPSTITVDGETCTTVTTLPSNSREKEVTCSAVMYGQTVRITRHGINQEDFYDRTLILCEMEIWVPSEVSQCPAGRHGTSCALSCSDHCGKGPDKNFCYQSSAYCYDGCAAGWYGDQCSTACSPGCQNNQCDRQTGQCAPCNTGYTGNTCTGCVDGYYGDMCDMTCPTSNCQRCHQDTGQCEECTLNSHLLPPPCTECENRYYKTNTGTCDKCSSNCQSQSCGGQTGRCKGCVDGYYGDMCDMTCPTPNCQWCHQDTRQCEECTLNSHLLPPPCTVCLDDYYKQPNNIGCEECLGICKSGTVCDKNTGYCSHCPSGKQGLYCDQEVEDKAVLIAVLVALLVISVCIIIILGVILCFRVWRSRKTARQNENAKPGKQEPDTRTFPTPSKTGTTARKGEATAVPPGAGQQDDGEHYEKVDNLPMFTRDVHSSAPHDITVQVPDANVTNIYDRTADVYQNTEEVHLYE